MEKKINQGGLRQRGRPVGKHRVPLSLEERRARNAQYERERRVEMSEALAELSEAAGCKTSSKMPDLLASVIMQLQRTSQVDHSSEVESLKRCNDYYAAQIADLKNRLAETKKECPSTSEQNQDTKLPRPAKRKRSEFEENTVYTSVPECPPDGEHTPPPSPSPVQFVVPEKDNMLAWLPSSSAIDQFSQPQKPKHDVLPTSQSTLQVPERQNVTGDILFADNSVEFQPVPLDSILQKIFNTSHDDSNIHFMSYDEMSATYF